MNLMQHWKNIRPTLAPSDEGAPAGDPPAVDTPPAPDAAGDPPADTPPAEPDFSWYPEQFRGEGGPDHEGFRAFAEEMMAAQAIQQEALAEVPEDPTGYEFTVPENIDFGELELPEDFSVQLNADDPAMAPLFQELGGILHKHNLPKGAAGELLGVLAKYEAAKVSQGFTAGKAEYQALGPSADARISNIERALDNRLPPDLATALKAATNSANGVKALEALLRPRGPATTPSEPPVREIDPLAARYPSSAK